MVAIVGHMLYIIQGHVFNIIESGMRKHNVLFWKSNLKKNALDSFNAHFEEFTNTKIGINGAVILRYFLFAFYAVIIILSMWVF